MGRMGVSRERSHPASLALSIFLCGFCVSMAMDEASSPLPTPIDVKTTTDEQCHKADEESLLQVSQEVAKNAMMVSPAKSQHTKCLRFMHIPKTAGSSVDSANFKLSPKRDFDSLTHRLYDKICATDPRINATYCDKPGGLGVLFEKTHSNNTFLVEFIKKHNYAYTWVPQPYGGTCQNVHTSPDVDPNGVAKFYDGPCDVFCTVREPLDRYISAYAMANIGTCTSAGFEADTRVFIDKLKQNRFRKECWFTPQVEMVYGALSKQNATKQYCNEILRFEHIDADFKALMLKYGHNLSLPRWNVMGHTNAYQSANGKNCYMDIKKVTTATKELVYNYYRADYEAFNYPRPF
jgi:hypothetical protein